ncbi:MAG: FecR domain-containing protein, partial [Deltaproteobacteria bacterium]|nr:FecR domain-containing protein [Deltaproteobacteria bacterium]
MGFRCRRAAVCALATLGAVMSASDVQAQTEAGEVAGFEGQAGIGRQGAHLEVAVGAKVIPGDLLATGERSRLVVFMRDGSILVLGPHTRMSVDKSVFAGGQRQTLLRLLTGKIRATVARVFTPGSHFDVTVATAVAGVRGTGFAVDATDPKLARVVVLSGSVGVRNPSVQSPEVMVPAGQFSEVGEGQPPKPAAATPPDLLKVLLDDTSARSLAAASVKAVTGAVKRFTSPLPVATHLPAQVTQTEATQAEPAAETEAVELQSGFDTAPFGRGTIPGREPFADFDQAKKV